jgi:hypothetical protein
MFEKVIEDEEHDFDNITSRSRDPIENSTTHNNPATQRSKT